jgi:hypothetical protein
MSAEVYKNDMEEKLKITFKIFTAANINVNQWKYYIIKKMSIFLNDNTVLMMKKIVYYIRPKITIQSEIDYLLAYKEKI